MSVRVHTTTVGNCAVRVLGNQAINELFGFYESPIPDGKSLVIEDGGNCEAWIITTDSSEQELVDFAKSVKEAALTDADYLDPPNATVVRIYPQELRDNEIEWSVDAVDHAGRYTEDCRTFNDLAGALDVIPEFVQTNGIFKTYLPPLDPHDKYTKSWWQEAVAGGDTERGYEDWVQMRAAEEGE